MAGIGFVGLGAVGAFLPLLPTTPFLLLAAVCFARSSERMHQALLASRWFGPLIADWQRHRALRPAVKRRAMLVVVLTFAVSIAVMEALWPRLMLAGLGLVLLGWLARLPTLTTDSGGAAAESSDGCEGVVD